MPERAPRGADPRDHSGYPGAKPSLAKLWKSPFWASRSPLRRQRGSRPASKSKTYAFNL